MKKRVTFLAFLMVLVGFSFTSCMKHGRKGHKDEQKAVTLNINLAKGEIYNLDLSPYGDEDDLANIETQAKEYEVSDLSKSGSFYNYQFQSVSDVKNPTSTMETVVLKVYEPENGRCSKDNQTLITINFNLK